jgi:hypothetical protein
LKACLEEKIKHRQHRPKIKVVRFVKMKKIVFICHTSTINETLFDGSVGAMGKNYTPVNHGLWSLVAMLCRDYYLLLTCVFSVGLLDLFF